MNLFAANNHGVHVLQATKANKAFEEMYLKVRSREKREYNDEELLRLPSIDASHRHFKEWLLRQQSGEKLFRYLNAKRSPLLIMDVGCGNGWFSNKLSNLPGSKVIGLDINITELQQAARVFQKPNLSFVYGNINNPLLNELQFDVVIFSASIQYFSSFDETINVSLRLLKQEGEIHILDTNFYKGGDLLGAEQRTKDYCKALGFPQMADHYFYRSIRELKMFKYKMLYDPSSIKNRILRTASPFPWICIKKN